MLVAPSAPQEGALVFSIARLFCLSEGKLRDKSMGVSTALIFLLVWQCCGEFCVATREYATGTSRHASCTTVLNVTKAVHVLKCFICLDIFVRAPTGT